MRQVCAAIAIAAAALGPLPCAARVLELRIIAQEPFAGGAEFGAAGAYERITAVAVGELDPNTRENAGIADLAQAPRTVRGMVQYDTDVVILRPVDPARGSGVMLYEVPNRGNKLMMGWLNDTPEPANGNVNNPRTVADAGIGFTFRRGYTMVWSGWQADVPASPDLVGIRVPGLAGPVVRRIRNEMIAGTRGPADVEVFRLPYPAATMDKSQARLTVRTRAGDARDELAADAWEFVDANSIRLLPAGSRFAPRRIYDLFYVATSPKVFGVGFAATRDVVSFLRYEQGIGNPLAGRVHHTMAIGISLSGRYLRHHIELGMNADSDGRRVFDGLLPHISGAGKVFANELFAMPGRTATQHEDRFYPENWFPFSYADTTDPVSGAARALARDPRTAPLIIETNSATEYWQKGASLVHTDPATGRDVNLPADMRMFMIAGTQHGGHASSTNALGYCANPRNHHSAGPALRALLAALEAWVVNETSPPDSRMPRTGDGSGVPAATLRLPAIPNILWPPLDNPISAPVDWTNPPAQPVYVYPTVVSAIDGDGNETAGLRLPDQAVPLGTFTGMNVYRDVRTELCDRDGIYAPFARTPSERGNDPRPSLVERYGTRTNYIAQIKAAADRLVADRLLLAEDAERYVRAAQSAPDF